MTFPLPPWLTLTRLAMAGLCVVVGVLLWPKSDHLPNPAIENGYRVARRLPSLRRETAERMRAYEAAQLTTNDKLAEARRRLSALRASVPTFVALPVEADTVPRLVMGNPQPGDTLIPLRLARAKLQEVVDSADAMLSNIAASLTLERGRVSLVMQSYQRTIAAQDTVIAGLRAEVERRSRPWYVRAVRGVEALGVGAACGGLGYIAFGPLGALGSAVACAAIDGVVR